MLEPLPDDAAASKSPSSPPARLPIDSVLILVLAALVVASRVPYLNDFDYLGKDGPLYIHSLALDAVTTSQCRGTSVTS